MAQIERFSRLSYSPLNENLAPFPKCGTDPPKTHLNSIVASSVENSCRSASSDLRSVCSPSPSLQSLHSPNPVAKDLHGSHRRKQSSLTVMARRVPLHDVETAIKAIEQDGAVILTDFSSITDVEKVNSDAAPFIAAFKEEVSFSGLPLSQLPPHRIE